MALKLNVPPPDYFTISSKIDPVSAMNLEPIVGKFRVLSLSQYCTGKFSFHITTHAMQ